MIATFFIYVICKLVFSTKTLKILTSFSLSSLLRTGEFLWLVPCWRAGSQPAVARSWGKRALHSEPLTLQSPSGGWSYTVAPGGCGSPSQPWAPNPTDRRKGGTGRPVHCVSWKGTLTLLCPCPQGDAAFPVWRMCGAKPNAGVQEGQGKCLLAATVRSYLLLLLTKI